MIEIEIFILHVRPISLYIYIYSNIENPITNYRSNTAIIPMQIKKISKKRTIVRCSILDNKRKKKEISIRVGSNGVSSPPLIDSRSVAEWSTLVFLNGPLSLSLPLPVRPVYPSHSHRVHFFSVYFSVPRSTSRVWLSVGEWVGSARPGKYLQLT